MAKDEEHNSYGRKFRACRSDDYATLIDFDIWYEIGYYFTNIEERLWKYKLSDGRPALLRHFIECTKEISYMLNSYIENPPYADEFDIDQYLLVFKNTVIILQKIQDYLDGKLEYAKEVIAKSRGFDKWEDVIPYLEAISAQLVANKAQPFLEYIKQKQLEEEKKNASRKNTK